MTLPMARFPIREAEIMRLAREMIAGFRQRPQDFPSLFVPVEQMEQLLAAARDGPPRPPARCAASGSSASWRRPWP